MSEPNPSRPSSAPAWYDPAKVILDLDVAPLLAAGEHPLARLRAAVADCAPGEIVLVRSGFRPEPLIFVFQSDGQAVWSSQENGHFFTCIRKS